MHFESMKITQWQQFSEVEIQFHERLTVLTGANGSGKTTILNLLAKHYGWELPSLSTPKKDISSGLVKFFSRIFNGENKSQMLAIGEINYSNGTKSKLQLQDVNTAQYQVQIPEKQPVKCFFIPSHRSVYRYQALQNLPTTKKNKKTAFTEVNEGIKQRYFSGNERQSSSSFMKNTLIGWAIMGYGVQSTSSKTIMPADQEQISNYEGFQEVLRKILPKSLGFQELEIRNMEVVFICNDGRDEFLLETVSGGISALIDMAWQIYMFSTKENKDCTVLIDEVENHLHPSMQRQVLLDLVTAFPKMKFIISTHSPLVVGSVKDSGIYALLYNDQNKIFSRKLDFDKKAKTASEILDEVLGVPVTMPVWAETQLMSIVNKYVNAGVTENTFNELRNELTGIGLENLLPVAIKNTLDKSDD